MNEFLSLIKLFRKLEALFLPMLPSGWQNPPPSYRIVVPVLEKLGSYKERFPWVDAVLYSIRKGGYRAYHEDGLATAQMSPEEMRWMRFTLGVVAAVMILAFTPKAYSSTLLVKCGLLLGGSALLFCGSMYLSISAMWASWGFIFPVVGILGIVTAPWALIFLGLWVLLWHAPLLDEKVRWQWFDWLSTLPILFFWMGSNWFQTLSTWQNGLVLLGLWLLVWISLILTNRRPRISRPLRLFWPASLVALAVNVECIKPLLEHIGIYDAFPRGWWIFTTVLLSFAAAEAGRLIHRRVSFPFRWGTVLAVFAIYGVWLFIYRDKSDLEGWIDNNINLLHYSIWPIWWIIGAGIIMLIRKIAMVLLKWVEVLLPAWIIPLSLLVLPALAYYAGWFSYVIEKMGRLSIPVLAVSLALGAAYLAWRKKETLLREWAFWGFYIFFLIYRYWFEEHRTVYGSADESLTGFLLLTLWLLWLCYDAIGEHLTVLRSRSYGGVSAVALMGAFLWFLVALLWLSYIDGYYSTIKLIPISKQINMDLLNGFTFLGIPFIIYHLIVRPYSKLSSSQNLPWGWIVMAGIGLVQILQGVEHYAVAWAERQSPDSLHIGLHEALSGGAPIESVTPAWVMGFTWVFTWRILRWAAAMAGLSWLIYHYDKERLPKSLAISATCLTSLAAGTAEAVWFWWPGMSPYWAVVFRPWVVSEAIWDMNFVKFYIIYGVAGLLWGWLLNRWMRRQSDKTLGADATRLSEV